MTSYDETLRLADYDNVARLYLFNIFDYLLTIWAMDLLFSLAQQPPRPSAMTIAMLRRPPPHLGCLS